MARRITTSVIIKASCEKIWHILTQFDSYPKWNPFIRTVSGDIREGGRIRVHITPPGGRPMVFRPLILSLEPFSRLEWQGHLVIPGLFDGRHIFEIKDNGDGTSTFLQQELFSGLLVPLIGLEKTRKGFEMMNARLKATAELKI